MEVCNFIYWFLLHIILWFMGLIYCIWQKKNPLLYITFPSSLWSTREAKSRAGGLNLSGVQGEMKFRGLFPNFIVINLFKKKRVKCVKDAGVYILLPLKPMLTFLTNLFFSYVIRHGTMVQYDNCSPNNSRFCNIKRKHKHEHIKHDIRVQLTSLAYV